MEGHIITYHGYHMNLAIIKKVWSNRENDVSCGGISQSFTDELHVDFDRISWQPNVSLFSFLLDSSSDVV